MYSASTELGTSAQQKNGIAIFLCKNPILKVFSNSENMCLLIGETATTTTAIDITAKERLYMDTLARIIAERQAAQPAFKKRKMLTEQS